MDYRTPGAYIEEISKLPPAIAQVETAIPVFIGYTEMAKDRVADDLINVAKRIVSPLEYEQSFGGAESETTITVSVTNNPDGSRSVLAQAPTSPSPFLMRYAIQQYYANGGGPCYILSVGTYSPAGPDLLTLQNALEVLKEEDEPTLIVYPDAINLGDGTDSSDYYNLYESALGHCAVMQDRFVLIDTYEGADWSNVELRNELTSDFLNYGAAYFPHIITSLNYQYDDADVAVTPGAGVGRVADSMDSTRTTVANIQMDATAAAPDGPIANIQAANAAMGPATDPERLTIGATVPDFLTTMIALLQDTISATNTALDLADDAISGLDDAEDPTSTQRNVILGARNAIDLNNLTTTLGSLLAVQVNLDTALSSATAADVQTEVGNANTALGGTAGAYTTLVGQLTTLRDEINTGAGLDSNTGLDTLEASDNELYHAVKREISRLRVTLPPSPMIAGIIARTDDARGFWKAPANVAVNNIVGPVSKVTNDIQDQMNVDPTAGKSVNAIRNFTGKGTLVWGARTLQGNSREWRYVNVRRSFIVIEESIKKGTEAFIFEPNDRNTWSKVKAMIDSYLTNLWRQGALFGGKPEESFKTSIGLGETMTYNDVLDGKMIVRIEIALVRPAEFIILQFEHKMVE